MIRCVTFAVALGLASASAQDAPVDPGTAAVLAPAQPLSPAELADQVTRGSAIASELFKENTDLRQQIYGLVGDRASCAARLKAATQPQSSK